jgi:hypothetical protein
LLDLLCREWQHANEGAWTHEDTKIMMQSAEPYTIWWSNRRSANDQLGEIRNGEHWVTPRNLRGRRRYLRFSDTDGNDWSQIAENLIEMCHAGRVWMHSDGDIDSDNDERIIEDPPGNIRVNYID